jgi:hypothetical protein
MARRQARYNQRRIGISPGHTPRPSQLNGQVILSGFRPSYLQLLILIWVLSSTFFSSLPRNIVKKKELSYFWRNIEHKAPKAGTIRRVFVY